MADINIVYLMYAYNNNNNNNNNSNNKKEHLFLLNHVENHIFVVRTLTRFFRVHAQ